MEAIRPVLGGASNKLQANQPLYPNQLRLEHGKGDIGKHLSPGQQTQRKLFRAKSPASNPKVANHGHFIPDKNLYYQSQTNSKQKLVLQQRREPDTPQHHSREDGLVFIYDSSGHQVGSRLADGQSTHCNSWTRHITKQKTSQPAPQLQTKEQRFGLENDSQGNRVAPLLTKSKSQGGLRPLSTNANVLCANAKPIVSSNQDQSTKVTPKNQSRIRDFLSCCRGCKTPKSRTRDTTASNGLSEFPLAPQQFKGSENRQKYFQGYTRLEKKSEVQASQADSVPTCLKSDREQLSVKANISSQAEVNAKPRMQLRPNYPQVRQIKQHVVAKGDSQGSSPQKNGNNQATIKSQKQQRNYQVPQNLPIKIDKTTLKPARGSSNDRLIPQTLQIPLKSSIDYQLSISSNSYFSAVRASGKNAIAQSRASSGQRAGYETLDIYNSKLEEAIINPSNEDVKLSSSQRTEDKRFLLMPSSTPQTGRKKSGNRYDDKSETVSPTSQAFEDSCIVQSNVINMCISSVNENHSNYAVSPLQLWSASAMSYSPQKSTNLKLKQVLDSDVHKVEQSINSQALPVAVHNEIAQRDYPCLQSSSARTSLKTAGIARVQGELSHQKSNAFTDTTKSHRMFSAIVKKSVEKQKARGSPSKLESQKENIVSDFCHQEPTERPIQSVQPDLEQDTEAIEPSKYHIPEAISVLDQKSDAFTVKTHAILSTADKAHTAKHQARLLNYVMTNKNPKPEIKKSFQDGLHVNKSFEQTGNALRSSTIAQDILKASNAFEKLEEVEGEGGEAQEYISMHSVLYSDFDGRNESSAEQKKSGKTNGRSVRDRYGSSEDHEISEPTSYLEMSGPNSLNLKQEKSLQSQKSEKQMKARVYDVPERSRHDMKLSIEVLDEDQTPRQLLLGLSKTLKDAQFNERSPRLIEESKDAQKKPQRLSALGIAARISKDLPKGVNISRLFNQLDQSTETNLLKSISVSIEKGLLSQDSFLEKHLQMRSSRDQLQNEEDILLNDNDEEVNILLKDTQSYKALLLDLLDSPLNDDEDLLAEKFPTILSPKALLRSSLEQARAEQVSKSLDGRLEDQNEKNEGSLSVIQEEMSSLLQDSISCSEQSRWKHQSPLLEKTYQSPDKQLRIEVAEHLTQSNNVKRSAENSQKIQGSGGKRTSLDGNPFEVITKSCVNIQQKGDHGRYD